MTTKKQKKVPTTKKQKKVQNAFKQRIKKAKQIFKKNISWEDAVKKALK